jgi:hypothetical protein
MPSSKEVAVSDAELAWRARVLREVERCVIAE